MRMMMKRFFAMGLLLTFSVAALQAREVFPLNEGWRFFFRTENTSDNARQVTLPHSWNTDPTAEGLWTETTGNYQNDIYIPASWASKRLFVHFYGVQSVGTLFVNGAYVGTHHGGATAFTFEITDKVHYGADNALMMVVSNGFRDDVLPTSTDMNLYGGIYREAELILTEKTAVSPLYLGTSGVLVHPEQVGADRVAGNVEVHLTSTGDQNCMLTLDITAPDGQKVFNKRQRVRLDGKAVNIPFSIDKPALWSPKTPTLYRVTASIGDDQVTDCVTVQTGFRDIKVTPAGGFQLNGVRNPIHGVTLYHDNLSGGTLTSADYDADLKQIQDLGANAIRSAVMPHAPYLYDRCDELGLMAWIDMPLHRTTFLSDMAYYATPAFEQNGLDQLQEIIAQNMNHPSVVMWGLFSRLWTRGNDPTPYIRRLNDMAHVMDPSRPTVACSDQDGSINFVTDLVVWQQEVGWSRGSADDVALWSAKLHKNWSKLNSAVCYGGSGFTGHRSYTTQNLPLVNWMPEEKQTRFHEDYTRNLMSDSLFWGVWVNNMYDYGSSRSPYGLNGQGLVTLNRREYKDAYYLYRALWNHREPTLYIVDKRRALREHEKQAFRIYSSDGDPRLLVGTDSVKLTRVAPCQYRSDSIAMHGTVMVKAMAATLRDSVVIRVGNVLKPQYSQVPRRTAGL